MREIIKVWLSRDIDSTEENEGSYHISHRKLKLVKGHPIKIGGGEILDCFYSWDGEITYCVDHELIEEVFQIKLKPGKQMRIILKGE
ncbi:MAG TPA: hypothetical protein ENH85_03220 [Candidatus Scalindua sp.]|nr:hypothetical protein [Candidatus Scalindua sp.]